MLPLKIQVVKALLITGPPGCGKTSLIKEALSQFKGKAGGFYTQELREGGIRQGFELVTLDGKRALLASVKLPSPYQVGKYGVDVKGFEEVGVKAIREALNSADLVVIDEIGKMELFSPAFREVLFEVLNSSKALLATIMLKPHPFADKIKAYPEAKLLKLNRFNREAVLKEVLSWLKSV